MAKKLILLILIIPIIVMVCLFAVTKTVSNLIDVPVSNIKVIGDERHIYIDMDKNETHELEFAVYPTNAKNKDVIVTTEAIDGEDLAEFDFVKKDDNTLTVIPKRAGVSRVYLTTADGGFKDSVIVYNESTKLTSIDSTVPKSELAVGEKISISTEYFPKNPSNTLVGYISNKPSIASVNNNGVITALSHGTATITVISEFDSSIRDTITVSIRNNDVLDLGKTEIKGFASNGKIPLSIVSSGIVNADQLSYSYEAFLPTGEKITDSIIDAIFNVSEDSVTLDYEFTDTSFVGDVLFKITYTENGVSVTKECRVSKVVSISASFTNGNVFELIHGQTTFIPFTVVPEDAEVSFSVTTGNANASVRMSNNGRLVIVGNLAGVTKVYLTVTNQEQPEQTETIECDAVIKPKTLSVNEFANKPGLEGLFALGQYEYNSEGTPILTAEHTEHKQLSTLHVKSNSEFGEDFWENLRWVSSAPEVSISKDGLITFSNNQFSGIVDFYAEFAFGSVSVKTPTYQIRCVANGVNVYSYLDLWRATEENEDIRIFDSYVPVILHTDIIEDFGYVNGNPQYKEITTTYDATYYENTNKESEYTVPTVKALIRFRDDVFGNGHTVSAHNLTYGLLNPVRDAAGNLQPSANAIFKGPLNFIAMYEYNEDGSYRGSISVKAQDNICFAIYDGVTVSNVELHGCELAPDENSASDGSEVYNLVDLSYVGTTVEVLGTDVNINYSRLLNGRTVLRAFGGNDNDNSNEVNNTNVYIKNSHLGRAREFIMRVGSNNFVESSSNPSPKLPNDTSSNAAYNTKKTYNLLSEEDKAAYDENYIDTYITIENSIFTHACLFAIGMDAHFASVALADANRITAEYPSLAPLLADSGWYKLAKTSYGAKVSIKGDTRLYTWKDVQEVDSTSLIEIDGNSRYASMALDVQDMIKRIAEKQNYTNILTEHEGKSWVHAGVAFFGGGKNYGVFETEQGNFFPSYSITLGDAGRTELTVAAGNEPFYFFLYDKTSEFTPEVQIQKLKSGEAYDCLSK